MSRLDLHTLANLRAILQAFARWLGLTTALAAGLLIAWAADEARLCWQHGQCYESAPER